MKPYSPEVDPRTLATAEYVSHERWVKSLPDDVLLQVWVTLTSGDIKDSQADIIKAEMDSRGVDLHSVGDIQG